MKNSLQNVITFIFKYIWVFCALLITLELAGTVASGVVLMKETAQGVMDSVSSEVSGRVNNVVRLLNGLANDERISDVDEPLFDRAILTESYRNSYDLYMIALTDQDVNVISSDEVAPPETPTSLAYRDYMKKLYSTGEYQITDAMVAGADGKTVNYTIAVPIMKDEEVVGSVFGAIYYQDIDEIINKHSDGDHAFLLLGSELDIMKADQNDNQILSFVDVADQTHFFGNTSEKMALDMAQKKSGHVWEYGDMGFAYVLYQNVEPTSWTLVYRVNFLSIILLLLPTLCVKIGLYILMSSLLYVLGNRYLRRHLANVNHLLDEVTQMQKQIFHNEREDYDYFLQMTQQGLVDHLTGLSTRAVLINKMEEIFKTNQDIGSIIFLDLDDLKLINDTYGHDAGDAALMYFAQILKKYQTEYDAFIARYGGDEFVFILQNIINEETKEIIRRLSKELHTTITVKEHSFEIHASIGVAFYPEHGSDFEGLFCKADLALYTAKHEGKNCSFSYDTTEAKRI